MFQLFDKMLERYVFSSDYVANFARLKPKDTCNFDGYLKIFNTDDYFGVYFSFCLYHDITVNLFNCIFISFRSAFANQGEVCLSTSRIYVQRSIYDEFVKAYVEETTYYSQPFAGISIISYGIMLRVFSSGNGKENFSAKFHCINGVDSARRCIYNLSRFWLWKAVSKKMGRSVIFTLVSQLCANFLGQDEDEIQSTVSKTDTFVVQTTVHLIEVFIL